LLGDLAGLFPQNLSRAVFITFCATY
jgi:hypothetical protein